MKKYVLLSLLVFLFGFLTRAGSDLSLKFEPDVWDQINTKFLIDSVPIRYYSNILIRLDGNPTPDDQNIVKEYASMLDSLIDAWDVYVIEVGTANLVLEINSPTNKEKENQIEARNNSREIVESRVILNIPNNTSLPERKKILYYYLVRAIVDCSKNDGYSSYPRNRIAGAVFDEKKPEDITFHAIDRKIIKALYSKVFDDRSRGVKAEPPVSFKSVTPRNRFYVSSGAQLIGMLIAIIYLILIVQAGVIKNHHYDFGKFLGQSMLVFLAYLIQVAVSTSINVFFLNVKFEYFIVLANTLGQAALGVISIILIYLVEFGILQNRKDNLLLNTLIPFLTTTFIPALLPMGLTVIMPSNGGKEVIFGVTVTTVLFCSLIAVARTFYIYMSMQSRNLLCEKDVQLAQLSELHKQAELQSLQSKINPHFLYNSLNSIASLARIDGRKTEQMALALSDFFKYSLNKEQKQTVSLKEEIESIETYLTIEKVRFGDRLNYEIQISRELEEVLIPQFLIQPLVENAVKHGLSKLTSNGQIRVVVERHNKQLKIMVFDNGPGFPSEPIAGYGLQSIQEKLNLIYQNKAWLKWENEPEKYILIVLPFS